MIGMAMLPEAQPTEIWQKDLEAGPDQVIVLYVPPDTGGELDPAAIYEHVAQDATKRDEDGMRIVSMHAMPLRHGGVYLGRNGSGFETRVAVVTVYERRP
jgi:hypothetical protein